MEKQLIELKKLNGLEDSAGLFIGVSNSPQVDYQEKRKYRSVFGVQEITDLYVDLWIIMPEILKCTGGKPFTVSLMREDVQHSVSIAEKQVVVQPLEERFQLKYTVVFHAGELAKPLEPGAYRIRVDNNGLVDESGPLILLNGGGNPKEYMTMRYAGLYSCSNEKTFNPEETPVSYRSFKREGLDNIELCLMFRNEYTGVKNMPYEMFIRLLHVDGRCIASYTHIVQEYVEHPEMEGWFAVEFMLWNAREAIHPGSYRLIVSCFDAVVIEMPFTVGDKDVEGDFMAEMIKYWSDGAPKSPKPPVSAAKEAMMDRLYSLVGLRKVKEEITRLMNHAEFVCMRRANGFEDSFHVVPMIFTGHPGTGKNTVAGMLGELYQALGLLSNGKVNRYKRDDLVRDGVAAEEQLVRQALKDSLGGVMFVDHACDLFCPEDRNDRGIIALGILYKIITDEQPEVLVILSDDAGEMDVMLEAMPDLKKFFRHRLCFEDYSPEELMEITRKKLEKLQYRFSPAAEDKFYKKLKAACVANEVDFTNGHYIDEEIEEAALRMSRRLMANAQGEYTKEDLMLIREEDIEVLPEGNPEAPMQQLEAMVGLGELKQSIAQHLNYVYFLRERQKQGFADVMPPLNMIFSGNPGTGKLTVAKMMGEIYHSVGVLERPDVVVQDGRNLAGDTGMAPQQAADLLMNMAEGGILYLNHADALPQSEAGLAVFEGLLGNLSTEECGDTIVILGGYPDRLAKMLEMNPALRSYFPNIFQFNDYSPEELMQIAVNKLKEKEYVFHPKAREVFAGLMRKAYENRNKNFGNVLLAEKVIELAIRNMSARTMKIRQERELTRQEITTIREDDIPVNIFEMPKFEQDVFDEESIRTALEELDQMVGQPGIKKQIRDFVELARHYSREGVKLSSKMSLQWCLTGNSAMGKGTVARIIARLYKAMGIVPRGQVINFKVERLIGLMEDEAQRSIGEALMKSNGGILLFDEDSPKLNEAVGFRERVRAILMNQMAERPGSYIIVYAEPRDMVPGLNGDAEHMNELVNVLVFEDYTKEELMVILKRRLDKENMKMTSTARQHMGAFIGSLVSTEERSHASSRLMRIVADMIVRNCLQRIAKNLGTEKTDDTVSVQKQDVAMFTEQFVAGVMKERKRIGFV